MSWARLFKRVFDIDIERCACGGRLKIIAAIEDPAVIVRILTHLGLLTAMQGRYRTGWRERCFEKTIRRTFDSSSGR